MRHIKAYNENIGLERQHQRQDRESIEVQRVELTEFCNNYLAYLIDDGWRVRVTHFLGDSYFQIIIASPESEANREWYEIKDAFEPFYHMLLKEYQLVYEYDEPAIGIMKKDYTRYGDGKLVQTDKNFRFETMQDDDIFTSLWIRVKKGSVEKKKPWFKRLINR